MEIIAKTNSGVLISATENEVKEIINAVSGERPKELSIGQKIPAIDYSSTITKIKTLSENTYFKDLVRYAGYFTSHLNDLTKVVGDASKIESV